jgi:biopolymer transport protein ExbB/TolQ
MNFSITEKFLEFALLGAEWVMWLLVVLSVISVYVMIERTMFFTAARNADLSIRKRLLAFLAEGNVGDARKLVEGSQSPSGRVVGDMLGVHDRGDAALEATRAGSRADEKIRLERHLSYLGTLGANAPFIGLFGTVLGIIQAFNDLAAEGVKPGGEASTAVMSGISEALVATAVGLLVAIPAVVAYNVFQRRVKRTLAEIDGFSANALVLLQGGPESDREED